MSSPISSNETAAFLARCISQTRSERDVYETLGLFSQTSDARKDPDFYEDEANKLRSEIINISTSFARRHHDLQTFEAALLKEATFFKDVEYLGSKYGQEICDISKRGQRGFPELKWNQNDDQTTIRFHIRCWLVSVAVSKFSAKRKGKNRQKCLTSSDEEQSDMEPQPHSSNTGNAPQAPSRAPVVPNMYPASISHVQDVVMQEPNTETRLSASIDNDVGSTNPLGVDMRSRRSLPSTPSKRKQVEVQGRSTGGKLPRISREAREISLRSANSIGDVYAVPRSPTIPLNAGQSSGTFWAGRFRESTQNTDDSYRPILRDNTIETETMIDENEIAADAIDLLTQSQPTSPVTNPPWTTPGPPEVDISPLRQDSVIPNVHDQAIIASAGRAESHTVGTDEINTVHTDERRFVEQDSEELNERTELFKLLLSYLNSINEFKPSAYNAEAEQRMDDLLEKLWVLENDGRLNKVFRSWMSMRNRLVKFRTTTGYFAGPGNPWKAHLNRMPDLSARAQACIAYVDLMGTSSELGRQQEAAVAFDEDLATVFDLVTKIEGCNGASEFLAVRLFNEALFEWFYSR